jgi:hypothetical protein
VPSLAAVRVRGGLEHRAGRADGGVGVLGDETTVDQAGGEGTQHAELDAASYAQNWSKVRMSVPGGLTQAEGGDVEQDGEEEEVGN